MIKELQRFTAEMEGLRLMPYKCPAGKLTIGYGHNLEDNGISQEVAEKLLADDLNECDRILKLKFAKLANKDSYIKAICRDMLFNLGYQRFSTFLGLIKALEKDDRNSALAELVDSLWFTQVGRRSKLIWLALSRGSHPIAVYDDFVATAKHFGLSLNYLIDEDFGNSYILWYETKASPFYKERPKLKVAYDKAKRAIR